MTTTPEYPILRTVTEAEAHLTANNTLIASGDVPGAIQPPSQSGMTHFVTVGGAGNRMKALLRSNEVLSQWLMRVMRAAIVPMVLVLLSACATTQLVEHGIAPRVRGTQPIHDIYVVYGQEVIRFDGKRSPDGGGGWTAYMPVPDEMSVSWTVDGERQTVKVPLRGKWDQSEKLANWLLRFDGRRLEVWREDDDPNSRYYRKPPVRVYP